MRFDQPGNGAVELVLSEGPPPWPRSAIVPLEEVRAETRRLACAPVPGGLEVRPGASGWLLAVSVAEGTAAIGAYHRHVNLPPPRGWSPSGAARTCMSGSTGLPMSPRSISVTGSVVSRGSRS